MAEQLYRVTLERRRWEYAQIDVYASSPENAENLAPEQIKEAAWQKGELVLDSRGHIEIIITEVERQ